MDSLHVVSLNVRGNKRHTVYRWLKEHKFHICLLQETYCTKGFAPKMKKGWDGDIMHSFSTSPHSKGVSILTAKGLPYNVISTHCDNDGRLILTNLELNGVEYSVCNVYCPNDLSDRLKFLGALKRFVNTHAVSKKHILVGGDFNCVDSMDDKSSGTLDKSSTELGNLKCQLNLNDIWRYYNPDIKEYSYMDPSGRGRNSRIDLLLGSESLTVHTDSCAIKQAPAPDHKAVTMNIRLRTNVRGKGYWKLNNSIINDEEYVEGITKLYEETVEEYGGVVSTSLLWEFLKIRIKEYSIAYSIAKSHRNKNHIKDLEEKLDKLDKANTILSSEQTLERKLLKQQLDEQYENKSKGYQVRSRSKWIEQGEQSTSYFLGLEKARQASNCITCLEDETGTKHHSDDAILNVARSFYEKLYQSNASTSDDIDTYFNSLNTENVLSDEDSLHCEGLVSLNECTIAVKKMKGNKSPGLDGISIEFYQLFWPLLGNLLVEVFNESHEDGKLPESQRKSVFSLIHKKDREDDVKNYRPISLTNIDYRILAFTLSERLHKVLNNIICSDQCAYVRGRYMGTNIRLVNDVIDFFDMTDKNGILFMLDFTKAFDSLEWNFLLKTLRFFNFGPSFIKWIETIYYQPVACVKNNGHFSDTFGISRGIRQGCPVSALLFIVCAEILGTRIRSCNTLGGSFLAVLKSRSK